jgi:serine phosphatase RsbU (regulator of sigma subunit)
MNYSLRSWLIISFTFIIIFCSIVFVVFLQTQNKTNQIDDLITLLQNSRILLLETNKIKEDIFLSELINPNFYTSEHSMQERKLNVSFKKIQHTLKALKESTISDEYNYKGKLNQIETDLLKYQSNYLELIKLFKRKGYKDYGIEGSMREYAHAITNHYDPKVKYYSLLLRKNEKDFLIRKEIKYILDFNQIEYELINYIHSNTNYNTQEKNELYNLVYFYNKHFKAIAKIENQIGIKGSKGLINYSNTIFEKTNTNIKNLELRTGILNVKRKEFIKNLSVVILFFIIIFLFIISYYLIKSITRSVSSITETFTNYTSSGFNQINFNFQGSHIKEFNVIYKDFLKMAKEINSYTNHFKEKVYERTLEINKQKEEIQKQQKQIEKQYINLLQTNSELILQKKLLNERNNDIVESLKYAKRIQKALLPKANTYDKYFKENFVFTKAKDFVSGDFNLIYPFKSYSLTEDSTISHNNILFLGADCTGHGVPGAFISVLGINSINKLVKLLNINDPGDLLNHLDADINHFLSIDKKDKDLLLDGMDISVFSFNLDTYVLRYCVAKYNCILIRNSEFIDLKSYNYSIGYNIASFENKNFASQTIQIQENDCLYLMSDGFHDQFGGPLNKKYKRKSLNELIMHIHKKPMKEQKTILSVELKEWKRHYAQTDDISVIGIRF